MNNSVFNKVIDSTKSLKNKVTELKDDMWGEEQKAIIQEFKGGGVNKVKSVLTNMNNSTSLFLKAGYELQNVEVKLGIPPEICASFHYNNKISDDERDQLLESIKEQKIISLTISCLLKAGDFYEVAKMGDYKLGGVVITLGLTPGITVLFAK